MFGDSGQAFLQRDREASSSGSGAGDTKTDSVAHVGEENGASSSTSSKWLVSFEDAQDESKRTGKPILTNFTGSNWCGYCVKLKKEVFSTPQFKNWAKENVVLLELDYPKPNDQAQWIQQQNRQLKNRYQISGYPTVLLLTSTGDAMGKLGYMKDADKWISVANNSISSHQSLQTAELIDASDMNSFR